VVSDDAGGPQESVDGKEETISNKETGAMMIAAFGACYAVCGRGDEF